MAQTLEQQRAQDAWNCTEQAEKELGKNYEKYVRVAKGLPALIMNSGLMQVLAYAQGKDKENKAVSIQLCTWLSKRFPKVIPSREFHNVMKSLMSIENSQDYQAINVEALAWLKWLRQMAAAHKPEKGSE